MNNSSPSLKQAATELMVRRRARSSILDFCNAIDVPGRPVGDDPETEFFQPIETTVADHHRLLLTKLDEVSRTPHGRMMVFMPPGSAKSTYASVVFPANYLGREPNRKVILASYGDDLARKMGRRTRSIIRQQRFRRIFDTELTADSQAAQEFSLTNGSEYMSCGILSGITGNRAHGIIIDDPIKGREQADSDTVRKKTWDAYEDDLKTRLIPGGWIVLIQTRWHEDDLAGRILPEDWKGESGRILCRDGNEWEVICLQARCEVDDDPLGRKHGEYLWPQWFDRKHWAQFESNARTWAALYQQRPAPPDGILFKPDQIRVVDAAPIELQAARGWDFAATEDDGRKSPDWTVGGLIGRDALGRFWICDVNRFRGSPLQVEQAVINTAAMDGQEIPISGPQDPGQAGKSQAFAFIQKLAGYDVEFTPETGSKVTRAMPLAAQVEAGNVFMVRASWNKALIDEMRAFPNGTHDDQVDALSRAFHRLLTAKRWVF
ncbi:phage terminase large subunit [Burkholderia multivorans]|uniref:phage terminase large subunit n=1 Tax=Burkholderia multivorans TaxID=87883 RepID=UPI0021C229E3|nr:phage terminase large subunit [Burkholderia multivorans]